MRDGLVMNCRPSLTSFQFGATGAFDPTVPQRSAAFQPECLRPAWRYDANPDPRRRVRDVRSLEWRPRLVGVSRGATAPPQILMAGLKSDASVAACPGENTPGDPAWFANRECGRPGRPWHFGLRRAGRLATPRHGG